ncbi:MAG: acetate kinase [Deltaproteobacteria bacterium]|nr:acetate kinase [Deltaproteobacteria bacterium]
MVVLVLNCGSSSLKFSLIDPESGDEHANGTFQRIGTENARFDWSLHGDSRRESPGRTDYRGALDAVMEVLRGIGVPGVDAVGHRFVHGGERFTESTIIDDSVLAVLESYAALAPLHNPANLMGIEAAMRSFPDVAHVAVFDTAFHQTMPPRAFMYAVPYGWYRDYGVRRYGFHGTSHRYASREAARRLGLDPRDCALVTAHLGNGCSTCAVKGGVSIDTSMGMTPLEGLMMGTRSGDVDPGLHAHLADAAGMNVRETTDSLNRKSGLLGVSGVDSDMRTVLDAASKGNERAELAFQMFCYRLAKSIGGMAVALARVDALVFTGGIGENSARVRAQVIGLLAPLGFELDDGANLAHGQGRNGLITRDGSTAALVVTADEALLIARDTWDLAAGAG